MGKKNKKEKKIKKVDSDITYVKLTFGFGSNRFGYSRTYKKGTGDNLHDALIHLFRQRGNNFMHPSQRNAILDDLKRSFETVQNESYVHIDARREKGGKSGKKD